MKNFKELTHAEQEVMHILWKKEKAFVKDIVEEFPQPRPAYNTVSTIIRILESKGFVGHKAYGKSHEYFPLIEKEKYMKGFLKNVMKSYFGNSFQNMVSFFAKENKMTTKDLDELMKEVKKEIK